MVGTRYCATKYELLVLPLRGYAAPEHVKNYHSLRNLDYQQWQKRSEAKSVPLVLEMWCILS